MKCGIKKYACVCVCVCSFVCRETNFDVSQYLLKNKSKTERGKYKYTFSEQCA